MSERLAILIGNGRFENDPDLPALFGPRHDVTSLGELLSNPEIGNFIVVEHLDRDSDQLASELERLFSISETDATVLLYYAGFVVNRPGKGLFLATADTELADIDGTAVPLTFIKGLLRDCPADNKAVILDCCYGGPAGRVDEADIERELRRIRNDVDPGLHVIASPASGQSAELREITTDSGLEGRLTHCIVEGLATGAADRDGDNRTGVRDLNEYLGMRLGDDRPLWAGPIDGADPELVANPHPIEGVDMGAYRDEHAASAGVRWRVIGVGALGAALAAVAVAGFALLGDRPPGVERLEEYYSGPGLPDAVGKVADLDLLRDIINRTGWIEHVEPLDGAGFRYPSAASLRVDPTGATAPGTLDLGLRQSAIVEFAGDTFAFGLVCADGVNVATVSVELADGGTHAFDVRTAGAANEFFGFVSRQPVRRLRVVSTSLRFSAVRLYVYAATEHPRRGSLQP